MKINNLVLSSLMCLGLSQVAMADPGFTFDVTFIGTKNGKPEAPIVFKCTVVGNKARVDIPIDRDEWKKGDTLITTDGGNVFTLVSPSRKTVQVLNQSTLRAIVERENKGISVTKLDTIWKTPMANHKLFSRHYALSFRQGLISGKGAIDEQHEYTIAEPNANVPTFNPFVNYTLMEMASLLLKDKAFETAGITSVLPGGFVNKAVIHAKSVVNSTFMGTEKHDETLTLDSTGPVASEVPMTTFSIPEGFKAIP